MTWLIDKLLNLILIACGIVVVWLLLQVTSFATFRIPTDSMEPALLAGDNILVNKWVMGGRLFNIFNAVNEKKVKISRLPKVGKIRRNDILVFNFPYPAKWDSIGLTMMSYYVKRCVALPGDTFEIEKAHYKVRGCNQSLGNVKAQDNLMHILKTGHEKDFGIVLNGYPYNGVNWDIMNFGPLYLPAAGDCLEMSPLHFALYKNVIEWEQGEKLTLQGDIVLLNDSVIETYHFKENYYFVAGDKVMNSQDSRYWGLLPESFIVGKATHIWTSIDKGTDGTRWNRVLKKIE